MDLCWKKCWLNRDVFVIAEQLLHTVKAFSASHTSEWVGDGKRLEDDTAGTADPKGIVHTPKGCYMP